MKAIIRSWRQAMGISMGVLLCVAAALPYGPAGSASAASAEHARPSRSVSQQQAQAAAKKEMYVKRKELLDKVSTVSGIPWALLAAVDQYERTINAVKSRKLPNGSLIAIFFTDTAWSGLTNPDPEETQPQAISFFRGYGKDGSGDGLADRNNDLDRLAAMVSIMLKYGSAPEDIRIALWDYYQNSRSVDRIEQFTRLYAAMNTLDLHDNAFPLPVRANYSFRDTWGAKRGWGGVRIHEGTDLFARKGIPVRSTCYGVIEVMGWNPYGGWRLGIRDLNNVYHYYAHLSGYNKQEVKVGELVKPGQTIGWVGSSGYGKPGTSGRFPPHLHYGMYRDNGILDWSFDPYPYLLKWERQDMNTPKKRSE